MRDQTFLTLMRLVPKSALSTVAGLATRAPAPAPLHRLAMRAFARAFRVDVAEAERDLTGYGTFGEFFTRKLKEGARPIEPGEAVLVSPVDGTVSQVGVATEGRCVQAKGLSFSLADLLGDPREAVAFEGGAFATLYLSPRDYHRIHAPLSGQVRGYAYLPGELWPVGPRTVRARASLYSLNERLVTYLDTAAGRLAVVAVGATCVARIHAAYDDIVTHSDEPGRVHRYAQPPRLEKGAELGQFEMGSTVILLTEPGRVVWDGALRAGTPVRLGRPIGRIA